MFTWRRTQRLHIVEPFAHSTSPYLSISVAMAGSTTSSSSRKRGRDVEDERAKLSLDKVLRCKWCKRRSDDDNPTPKKHVGPYLKFTQKFPLSV